MSVTYTVTEYTAPLVVVCIGGLALILTLGIMGMFTLGRRYKNLTGIWICFVATVCSIALLVGWVFPDLDKVGDLLIPGEYVVATTAGRIEAVEDSGMRVGHFRDGKLCRGIIVRINGDSFYGISDGLLQEGMYIELQYARYDSNAILSWQEVTPEWVAQVLAEEPSPEDVQPEEKKETVVSPEAKCIGNWLLRIGFLGLVACVALSELLHYRIVAKRLIMCGSVKEEVRANPKALGLILIPFGCMLLIMLGLIVSTGNQGVVLILLMGVGLICGFMATDAATSLKLDGGMLTVRRLGKERTYAMEDVRGIYWRRVRGIIGKSMVLVMSDGKIYWFSMDTFDGVEDVFRRISLRLEKSREEA